MHAILRAALAPMLPPAERAQALAAIKPQTSTGVFMVRLQDAAEVPIAHVVRAGCIVEAVQSLARRFPAAKSIKAGALSAPTDEAEARALVLHGIADHLGYSCTYELKPGKHFAPEAVNDMARRMVAAINTRSH